MKGSMNYGLLGHNIVINKCLWTDEERKMIDGFMLTAEQLKEELKSRQKTDTITKTGKKRKPREGKATLNHYHGLFRRIAKYDSMPSGMENLFIGATRQHTGNSNINKYVVFALLKSLPVISTESVFLCANQRRVASEIFSDDYAQQLAKACRNVIKVFDHHHENITEYIKELDKQIKILDSDFDIEADAAAYLAYKQPEQTPEQLILKLNRAGLTKGQIKRYLKGEFISGAEDEADQVVKIGHSVRIRVRQQPENITEYNKESLKWLPSVCCYVDTETGELFSW